MIGIPDVMQIFIPELAWLASSRHQIPAYICFGSFPYSSLGRNEKRLVLQDVNYLGYDWTKRPRTIIGLNSLSVAML